jgi:hypothetical protein
MGRPEKPPSTRRGRPIQIRMSEDEHAAISKAAKADVRTIADWARLQLLKAAGFKAKEGVE